MRSFYLCGGLLISTFYMNHCHAVDVSLLGGGSFYSDFKTEQDNDSSAEKVAIESSAGWTVRLNLLPQDNTQWELYYSHNPSTIAISQGETEDESFKLTIELLHIGGVYYIENSKFNEYAGATFGATHFIPENDKYDDAYDFSTALFGGAGIAITDSLLINLDLRLVWTSFNSSAAIFCSGGCVVTLQSQAWTMMQTQIGLTYRF